LPELPEVETVVNSLQKIPKKTIKSFHTSWHKICYNNKILNLDKSINNKKIYSIYRKGKNIIFDINDNYLVFQLRMTGYLYHSTQLPSNMKYVRCYFILNDDSYLIFEDIRKFGGFYIYKDINHLNNRIGIDPFEKQFTYKWLQENILKRNRQIKGLLLDQNFICGLGNIYIDEILWFSRIHPLRLSSTLSNKEIKQLFLNIIKILKKSIDFHGTTFMNFKFDNMKTGNYKSELEAYGREGKQCQRCLNIISKIKVSGRGTHLCKACQSF